MPFSRSIPRLLEIRIHKNPIIDQRRQISPSRLIKKQIVPLNNNNRCIWRDDQSILYRILRFMIERRGPDDVSIGPCP